MNISNNMSDDAILEELGGRITRRRLDLQLTQAGLAEQAGVSKRTLERIESGEASHTSSFVRILRALDVAQGLDQVIPETGPSPMAMLKYKGKERQRASSPRQQVQEDKTWHWGEEK